jgi:hypothetical protein
MNLPSLFCPFVSIRDDRWSVGVADAYRPEHNLAWLSNPQLATSVPSGEYVTWLVVRSAALSY